MRVVQADGEALGSGVATLERLRRLMHGNDLIEALRSRWRYARETGVEVLAGELERVHPRGSDEFVLEYRVRLRDETGERTQPLVVELLGDGAERRWREVVLSLQKSRRKQVKAGNAEVYVACFADLGVIVRFPALDEKLAGLKLFHKSKVAARVLAEHLQGSPERVQAELLGHRLGRRCTARFRVPHRAGEAKGDARRSLIAKMYKGRGGRGEEIYRAMLALRHAGFDGRVGFCVPRPLEYLHEWRTLLMEDVDATVMAELEGPELVPGAEAAARMIACFHGLDLVCARTHGVDEERDLLGRWVALVGSVHEGLYEPVGRAWRRVRDDLARAHTQARTPVHRDFYDKQVLLGAPTPFLIDFDTLCASDPAIDVGNFLAHCRLRAIQVEDEGWRRAGEAFAQAYEPPRSAHEAGSPEFPLRVEAYRNATLLRLACLYSFWPRWNHVCEPLLESIR